MSTTREMQIFVKTLSGRSLVVDIQPTNTVYQLKAKIYEKEGIPPDQQKLVHSGELVTPINLLHSYSCYTL